MAFSASKKRERKAPEPIGRGTPIIPSSALELWYRRQIESVAAAMVDDYREQIKEAMKDSAVQKFFTQDAGATSQMTKTLDRLQSKWKNVFQGFALSAVRQFTGKVEEQATASTLFSLSAAGIKEPRATYSSAVANILDATKTFNHTLISNVQEDVHEKIFTAVMLSLTSPNPEQQGQSGIENALKEIGHFAKDRVKLIARDQTSKLYSSLSDERMRENGVEEFEWAHSSAGKVPRQSHVEKNGMRFKLDDPRLWDGPKADRGPPGWAINCRCRKIPII